MLPHKTSSITHTFRATLAPCAAPPSPKKVQEKSGSPPASVAAISQVLVKPVGELLGIFGRSPEVPPAVPLARTDNQFDVRRAGGFRPLDETLGLLQRDDL